MQFNVMMGEKELYQKNKLQSELIKLRSQMSSLESRIDSFRPDPVLLFEIQALKDELKLNKLVSFSGVVMHFVMP